MAWGGAQGPNPPLGLESEAGQCDLRLGPPVVPFLTPFLVGRVSTGGPSCSDAPKGLAQGRLLQNDLPMLCPKDKAGLSISGCCKCEPGNGPQKYVTSQIVDAPAKKKREQPLESGSCWVYETRPSGVAASMCSQTSRDPPFKGNWKGGFSGHVLSKTPYFDIVPRVA